MTEKAVFLSDLHAPYGDETAFREALAFSTDYKPKYVFVLGDWADFYQCSKFSNDPERRFGLQEDIDDAVDHLYRLRDALPKARITFCRGNHELRLHKYLCRTADALASLRTLRLEKLLHFEEMKITYIEQSMMFHGYLVKHGHMARSKAGYTAMGEMERNGVSGISGHTHRLAQVHRRTLAGHTSWTETGCLCRLDPDYAEGQTTDWTHGMAFGALERNNYVIHLQSLKYDPPIPQVEPPTKDQTVG